jgi:hypothetical protein
MDCQGFLCYVRRPVLTNRGEIIELFKDVIR